MVHLLWTAAAVAEVISASCIHSRKGPKLLTKGPCSHNTKAAAGDMVHSMMADLEMGTMDTAIRVAPSSMVVSAKRDRLTEAAQLVSGITICNSHGTLRGWAKSSKAGMDSGRSLVNTRSSIPADMVSMGWETPGQKQVGDSTQVPVLAANRSGPMATGHRERRTAVRFGSSNVQHHSSSNPSSTVVHMGAAITVIVAGRACKQFI